jgi:hypothetical protein
MKLMTGGMSLMTGPTLKRPTTIPEESMATADDDTGGVHGLARGVGFGLGALALWRFVALCGERR